MQAFLCVGARIPTNQCLNAVWLVAHIMSDSGKNAAEKAWDTRRWKKEKHDSYLSRLLLEGGYPPSRISLLAPYRAQRQYVNMRLRDHGLPLHCSTTHGIQGKENEVVIFMTTRSNKDQNLGLLTSQPEILNVATSRHRRKLVLVSDSRGVFSDGSRTSKDMFDFMDNRGIVGPVSL